MIAKKQVENIMILFVCFAVLSSAFMMTASAVETIPGTVEETTLNAVSMAPMAAMAAPTSTSLSPMVTETGKISLSVDGLGTDGTGIIQVEKPDGATVKSAYMMGASLWGAGPIADGQVKIDGQDVNWNFSVNKYTYNHWADVTPLVKTKIDNAPTGRIDFTITELKSDKIDGTVLVVIFDDPNQVDDNTIVLLFGAQSTGGDTFKLLLAEPIDTITPEMSFDMGLGISFSAQPTGQYSIVDVNGKRLTTAAGGQDDGYLRDGELLTVGGLDDSNDNPADPYALATDTRSDDELYNILPFVEDGDSTITVYTENPSDDDNIFFAYFNLKSTVAVVGEGIVLSPASATNPVGTSHTVTATVQDDDGSPVESKEVTFEVVTGPHAEMSTSVYTDSNGEATFTYLGTDEGTDSIVASFVDSQQEVVSSNKVVKIWETEVVQEPSEEIPEFPTVALPIAAILGLAFIINRRKEE
ncbi:MAG: Ig-like domain-containing protein [Methanolobus sp.]|nr:Ig-like domain-containing protein [Methanolobus sp.]